ncbi:MAG: hypothetical protein HY209_00975 [Candidatus Omnitrophica bacterium]|nr:hypothetical protein [Candidatus Omnitrophota bacterium]
MPIFEYMQKRLFNILILLVIFSLCLFSHESGAGQQDSSSVDTKDNLLKVAPEYFMGSSYTGGDFYFWAPGEFGSPSAASITAKNLIGGGNHDQSILLDYGEFNLKGEVREFNFPVEANVKKLSLFVGLQDKVSVTVSGPDGQKISGDEFKYMFLKTIQNPSSGNWKMIVNGRGLSSISVRACCVDGGRSDVARIIDFYKFEIVRPNSDIHGGFFPIEDAPVVGKEELCSATILGKSYKTAQFQFVTMDGQNLQTVDLNQNYPSADPEAFIGSCKIPQVPFRVKVVGIDNNDMPYQRFSLPLIQPRGK